MNNLNAQVLSKISTFTFTDGKLLKDYVSNLIFRENNVGFSIDIGQRSLKEGEEIKFKLETSLNTIENIGKVTIVLTSSYPAKVSSQKPKQYIDNVKKVILVAAGKGGVGKSTIASLVAQELQSSGKNIGIVDADIYGPSIPQIFGAKGMPEILDKKMIPLQSHGIQINSIGFLTKGEAIAWRGPMASKAIYQLLSVTAWKMLDYLIIDMPPGTGDIHLSILENYHVDGVIIVTTPQKISEIDVQKAIELYKKFDLSIIGIIENMSYFINDKTGEKLEIFAGQSGELLSKKYNVPLIGELPIIPDISKYCDLGNRIDKLIHLNIKEFL